MSESVTINEDGVLVVDMAKADALWHSLDPLKQAELTNMMFEPVLKKAKEQADLIEELQTKLEKAMKVLEQYGSIPLVGGKLARDTIAELKGQDDE